jgi:hypothetical protein
LFNLCRDIGSSVGIALFSALITENTQRNHAEISGYVTPFNRIFEQGSRSRQSPTDYFGMGVDRVAWIDWAKMTNIVYTKERSAGFREIFHRKTKRRCEDKNGVNDNAPETRVDRCFLFV